MSKSWQTVALGTVVAPVIRPEAVDPTKEYRLLGVRLEGAGPFLRETVLGSEIAANTLYKVEQGDFIYSRLFAWRGGFGVIRAELDGCYVSSEFPTFRPITDRIDLRFLSYWFRLPETLQKVGADCTGSTPLTRNRFKEAFFLDLEIPLPPITEQRRIVARIEALALKIEEARTIRDQTVAEADRLVACMAHRRDLDDKGKNRVGWQQVNLGEVLRFVDDAQEVKNDRNYPNLGIYSFGRGLFHKPPIDGALTSARSFRRVKKGQFIYSRLFAFEGAYGLVTEKFDGHFVSSEYPTFDSDRSRVRPEFVAAYFKAPSVWQEIATGSKGIGHRRQRVQPERILAHRAWLPPLGWQERIVDVSSQVARLKQLQAETSSELDALLPSLLDRAFSGEL